MSTKIWRLVFSFCEIMLDLMLPALTGTAFLFAAKLNVQAKKLYGEVGFEIVDETEVNYNGKGVHARKMEKSVGIQSF